MSRSYALQDDRSVETLATTSDAGTAAINLTGNNLRNTILGNAGNNIIDGQEDRDVMNGRGGNDTYRVDNGFDVVVEANGGGTDRVLTTISYALRAGQSIERLESAAAGVVSLTGNEIANTIIGNAGNNILDGKGGGDVLSGLGGNDTYRVDNAADQIIEAVGNGTDRVLASVNYTLGSGREVEFLLAAYPGPGPQVWA